MADLFSSPKSAVSVSVAFTTGLLILASVLVPICTLYGWNHASEAINLPLTFICHQLPIRCFKLFGIPIAICSRCFALYLGMFFCALLYWRFDISKNTIGTRTYLLLVAPLVIDGITQLLGFRISTNTIRAATGIVASVGTSLAILPFLTAKLAQSKAYFEQGGENV
ncbi:DUF2085 domain-containing protein [Patescibacteria group bacterium]|nr:DUF2085 domain-containing protein [Patescibacteria group bacterium]